MALLLAFLNFNQVKLYHLFCKLRICCKYSDISYLWINRGPIGMSSTNWKSIYTFPVPCFHFHKVLRDNQQGIFFFFYKSINLRITKEWCLLPWHRSTFVTEAKGRIPVKYIQICLVWRVSADLVLLLSLVFLCCRFILIISLTTLAFPQLDFSSLRCCCQNRHHNLF